jgi:hypothetical protein
MGSGGSRWETALSSDVGRWFSTNGDRAKEN